MKRVLVFGMNENPGGVESFIMNYYRKFTLRELQFDFLCNSNNKIAYEDEITNTGSKVFHITPRSRNPIKYYREVKRFFKKNASNYSAIWVNINSLANIDYLKLAKKYGIPVRIVHSHSSQNMDTKLREWLHIINKKKIEQFATDFWACSNEAASWFYDSPTLKKSKIIPNAIDIEKSLLSDSARRRIREQYQLQDNFVIGNVGRLHFQKNQEFIIKVFADFLKIYPQSKLVLIGQGEDEDKLKLLAKELAVDKEVLFVGVQPNVSDWLSAFDLFLFPSLFEGLGIAALEAQANGLPVIVSKGRVPKDVKINDNVYFYSLSKSTEEWAKFLNDTRLNSYRESKDNILRNFQKFGYDINEASKNLEKYFLDILNDV
ncbi:glycosyltransferase family 1 protein [Streptococcus hyointestinalis]|uniref:glycosyltransferase family 1 protein n=1 Tax=Streptococcus hyointestinalis TaxID=1337 RepID=UPI003512AC93